VRNILSMDSDASTSELGLTALSEPGADMEVTVEDKAGAVCIVPAMTLFPASGVLPNGTSRPPS
jgi:hypothetical protein